MGDGMTDAEIIEHCGDDARKWASEFCKLFPEMDEGLMISWFANAIERACDIREAKLLKGRK